MDVYAEAGGFDIDSSFSDGVTKKDRQRAPPNLTPLTCADIHSMTGERWTFGSHEAEKVCLVGVVRSIEISSLKATLVVDDRTGPPVICQSMDTNDAELERLNEGMYIKVFGTLRKQSVNRDEEMKTMINLIKLRAVSSLNEVSLHMMECVQARVYYLTAEKRLQAILGESQAPSQPSKSSAPINNGTTFDDSGVPGLNRKQQMVYQAIKEAGANDSQGLHINKLLQKINMHGVSEREARDALEFLSNEGHVYTTIDEDTYACLEN
ncbi:replication protein A 32 kDa subunit-A [Galendromus occidentalis]|uniref:Replication protein A 32 kDa subunit-A n=1 Tax=Galendromus occidentalis TaxID=34638 RepID=A0AAJ6QR20_9ACAR|nr:replication protein A 32 kDa subunit-A [Galendromus occidentalis]